MVSAFALRELNVSPFFATCGLYPKLPTKGDLVEVAKNFDVDNKRFLDHVDRLVVFMFALCKGLAQKLQLADQENKRIVALCFT